MNSSHPRLSGSVPPCLSLFLSSLHLLVPLSLPARSPLQVVASSPPCSSYLPLQTLLATASFDKTVRLSQVRDGSCLASLPLSSAPALLAFSPKDSMLLAVALDTNSVVIWDITGAQPRPLVIPPQKGEVRAVHTSGAVHTSEGSPCCYFYSLCRGWCQLNNQCCPPPPLSQLTGLLFSPNGEFLATWGQDCTVRLWPVTPAGDGMPEEPDAFFMCDAAISCCCFAPGGRGTGSGGGAEDGPAGAVLAVGDVSGHVHFLDLPRGLPVA